MERLLPDGTYVDCVLVVDETGTPTAGGGGGGGTNDRELVVTTYRAKNAFTGASVGDTITATQIIDVSGTPSTVSTIWRNQTTAADLAGAPAAANLELVGATALTDAQLRASRVNVEVLPAQGTARSITTSGTSASVTLTASGLRGVRLTARNAAVRFQIGTGAVTATASSHYLPAGAVAEFAVPASAVIAAIQDTAAGSLEITELT